MEFLRVLQTEVTLLASLIHHDVENVLFDAVSGLLICPRKEGITGRYSGRNSERKKQIKEIGRAHV